MQTVDWMRLEDCRLKTADCRLQTVDSRTATDTPNRHVKFKCQRETRQTTSDSEQREWGMRMGLELRLKLKWKRKYVRGWGENYLKR